MDASSLDPVLTNPAHYQVVMENERVRVLMYQDVPGDRTAPHRHPDSVMHTLTGFGRRLIFDDGERDVELPAGTTMWLPAQEHSGHNIGDTPTRVLFVELKESTPATATESPVATGRGPAPPSSAARDQGPVRRTPLDP